MIHPNVNQENTDHIGLLCVEENGLIWLLEIKICSARKRQKTPQDP